MKTKKILSSVVAFLMLSATLVTFNACSSEDAAVIKKEQAVNVVPVTPPTPTFNDLNGLTLFLESNTLGKKASIVISAPKSPTTDAQFSKYPFVVTQGCTTFKGSFLLPTFKVNKSVSFDPYSFRLSSPETCPHLFDIKKVSDFFTNRKSIKSYGLTKFKEGRYVLRISFVTKGFFGIPTTNSLTFKN